MRGGPLSEIVTIPSALVFGILPCLLLRHLVSMHPGPKVHPGMDCCFSSPHNHVAHSSLDNLFLGLFNVLRAPMFEQMVAKI